MREGIEQAFGPVARRRLWTYAVASAQRGYWDEAEKVLLSLMPFDDMRSDVLAATAFLAWRRTQDPEAAGDLAVHAARGCAVALVFLGYVHLDVHLPLPAILALQAVLQSDDPTARELAVHLQRHLAHHLEHSPLPS